MRLPLRPEAELFGHTGAMVFAEHLDEAGIIARLLTHTDPARAGTGAPRVEVGPGDDAAVVALPSNRLVITTDTMVEGHDFLGPTTTPCWIGHKAAVQNMADVAAMGARPLALVAAVSAPADTPVTWFEDVTAGLTARASRDGAVLVGGDLGRADQLTLTITAVGALAAEHRAVLRSGARPGDVVAIGLGNLGRSAAGLAGVLSGWVRVDAEGGVHVSPQGDASLSHELRAQLGDLVRWHDAPDPDLSLGWTSGRSATTMMDLSDGLVRDGGRIARASGVMIDLDSAALAPDVDALTLLAHALGEDPWTWVLHGGEEHAMLATFPPEQVPEGFRPLGRVRELPAPVHPDAGEPPRVLLDGRPIPGTGFDHFG